MSGAIPSPRISMPAAVLVGLLSIGCTVGLSIWGTAKEDAHSKGVSAATVGHLDERVDRLEARERTHSVSSGHPVLERRVDSLETFTKESAKQTNNQLDGLSSDVAEIKANQRVILQEIQRLRNARGG